MRSACNMSSYWARTLDAALLISVTRTAFITLFCRNAAIVFGMAFHRIFVAVLTDHLYYTSNYEVQNRRISRLYLCTKRNPNDCGEPPHMHSTSTSHRPYIDPKSTLHRPHIDPTSTLHLLYIDPRQKNINDSNTLFSVIYD